ncbi:hypothetical protein V6N13_126187 [Hibiscus sabdariffa]
MINGSNEEILSLPSQPCRMVDREVAYVDPTLPNRAQILVHNGVERKVRVMSDIVLSFLSLPKDNLFSYTRKSKGLLKNVRRREIVIGQSCKKSKVFAKFGIFCWLSKVW